jgi:hypothetical protein
LPVLNTPSIAVLVVFLVTAPESSPGAPTPPCVVARPGKKLPPAVALGSEGGVACVLFNVLIGSLVPPSTSSAVILPSTSRGSGAGSFDGFPA